MPCSGSAPQWAGWCLSFTQSQLGIPHCGATAAEAFSGCYSNCHTLSPQPNDMVFFAPDASNGGAGHVGTVNGDGSFHSVLSDGSVCDLSIGGFGVSVLGYVSTACVTGKPNSNPQAAPVNNAVTQALNAVSQGGSNYGRYVAWGAAALFGIYLLDKGILATADLA